MTDNLAVLIERLAAAQTPEPDDNDRPDRARVRKCLNAVIKHLAAEGVDLSLRAPLFHLYAALEDVAEGRNNDLFALAPVPHPSTKESLAARQDVMASAAVTILMNEGWTKDAAGAWVARRLKMDKAVLLTFRKNLSAGKLGESLKDEYAEWLKDRKKDRKQERFSSIPALEHVEMMVERGQPLAPLPKE